LENYRSVVIDQDLYTDLTRPEILDAGEESTVERFINRKRSVRGACR